MSGAISIDSPTPTSTPNLKKHPLLLADYFWNIKIKVGTNWFLYSFINKMVFSLEHDIKVTKKSPEFIANSISNYCSHGIINFYVTYEK
jgi:hypothetical protein